MIGTALFARLGGVVLAVALVVSGCQWTSPDENVLRVVSGGIAADGSRTVAIVEIPGMSRTLSPEQVAASAEFAVRARSGKFLVRFIRIKGAADTIGRAEVSFEIVKGYTYYAGLSRQRAGAYSGCIGCSGALKFPMAGSEASSTDSLHLDYVHGLPLCKNCVAMRSAAVNRVARRE